MFKENRRVQVTPAYSNSVGPSLQGVLVLEEYLKCDRCRVRDGNGKKHVIKTSKIEMVEPLL